MSRTSEGKSLLNLNTYYILQTCVGAQMRHSFLFITLLLLIITCFISQSNALTSSPFIVPSSGMVNYNPTPQDGWLHTDGVYIKDESGGSVALRIIRSAYNMPSWGDWEGTWTWILDQAKEHGVTFIELGWQNVDPDLNKYAYIHLVEGSDGLNRLDKLVSMCEERGLYVILEYMMASSFLINNGYSTGWQDVIPIDAWTFLIQRYARRPVVCGVKLIDEPNFSPSEERQMWLDAINTLKPLNPKLLWETYVINYLRLTEWSQDRWVWRNKNEVPANVFHGGGAGAKVPGEGGFIHIALDDYETAEQYATDIPNRIVSHYRDVVAIPCFYHTYSNHLDTYPNAHWHFLTEVGRNGNGLHLGVIYQVGIHQWFADYKQQIIPRILPDTPYPYYWIEPTIVS